MADTRLATVLIGAAIGGAGFSAFLIGYTTLLQRSTGADLQGRVFTAAEATAGVPYCLTLALAVLGIGLVDYRYLLVGSMLLMALAGAYLSRGDAVASPRTRSSSGSPRRRRAPARRPAPAP
jgi:hypothetical protein